MTTYVGLLRQSEDGKFSLTIPDLPGCTASGPTVNATFANAKGALSRWLLALPDGVDAPPPTPATEIAKQKDAADVLTLIDVPLETERLGYARWKRRAAS